MDTQASRFDCQPASMVPVISHTISSTLPPQIPGARLLELLDTMVQRDVGKPDLRGCLAVGVQTPAGPVYWFARFADQVSTGFGSNPPPDVDAAVTFAEEDADSILRTGSIPSEIAFRMQGDGALVKRFLARYRHRRNTLPPVRP